MGAYILTVSLILGGLLLSTDYLLVRIFAWLVGKPTKNLGRGMFHVGAAYARRSAASVAPTWTFTRRRVERGGRPHFRPPGGRG